MAGRGRRTPVDGPRRKDHAIGGARPRSGVRGRRGGGSVASKNGVSACVPARMGISGSSGEGARSGHPIPNETSMRSAAGTFLATETLAQCTPPSVRRGPSWSEPTGRRDRQQGLSESSPGATLRAWPPLGQRSFRRPSEKTHAMAVPTGDAAWIRTRQSINANARRRSLNNPTSSYAIPPRNKKPLRWVPGLTWGLTGSNPTQIHTRREFQ